LNILKKNGLIFLSELFQFDFFYFYKKITNMHIIPFLLKELEEEATTTRKFFKLIKPEDFLWKPHGKSMSIKELSTHIAELPSWIDLAVNRDEFDFKENTYQRPVANTPADLMTILEDSMNKATTALLSVKNEDDLLQTWTLRYGDKILAAMTKYEAIRNPAISQTIHHRAQLGVFLRLLDIPIPGSYGPSADEPAF
jgi:uncharacterized damage-inducible protein DinB